jgi:hypothetical protein
MRFLIAPLLAVLLAVAAVAIATSSFRRQVDGEARALLAGARTTSGKTLEAADLQGLPPPVRRWLETSGAVGQPIADTVRLTQRGEMRPALDKPWMPVAAEQYFTVDPPGFVWRVSARMKGLPIAGRDRYAGGHGHMLIKVASLVKVADATGPEIDQGTLLRFLGEIIWFPSAALSPAITWEAIDASHARATMRHAGVTATAVFGFDGRGRFASLTADRYLTSGGRSRLEKWVIPTTGWRVVRGIELPVRGNAIWKLPEGDFDYYRWEILDVEVNPPGLNGDAPARPEAVR